MKLLIRCIAFLATIACVLAIYNNDFYQDDNWTKAQWLGQDLITLTVAVPLLLFSLKRGIGQHRIKWWMLNTGLLLYFAYTYSFFVFSSKLSFLYFFQIGIFGFSIVGFIRSCLLLSHEKVRFSFPRTNIKLAIVSYFFTIASMLAFLWIKDIVSHLNSSIHQSNTFDGAPPLITYGLDLGLIIPLMIATGLMLYWKERWGYILTGIVLTKTSTLGFAMMAMNVSMHLQHINPDYLIILIWTLIGVLGTLLTIFYLENLRFHVDP
ncbi:MAG: hypothetical protein CMB99_11635 [Flavobacteriaceae bacterium]|nr:hypothetical protein [Flavobacteriaceae bacterium]|tara:strand:- start:234190 stop:234984 length:795 start_codon:yes stop_codon:yes gene_type:complete